MTDATYQIEIAAGTHTWTVKHTDPVAPSTATQVLDQVRIGWAFPSGKPWPAQPEPATLSLALLAVDADNLADLHVGDTISVICYKTPGAPPTDRFAGFRGRITDVDVSYVRIINPLVPGTLMTALRFAITAVDHTADLGEVIIDPAAWPQESTDNRLQHIADAIAATGQSLPFSGVSASGYTGTFAALDVNGEPALGVLLDHTAQMTTLLAGFSAGETWQRLHLVPEYDAGGTLTGYACYAFWDRIEPGYLPATLALVAGILGLTFPTTFEALSADACDIPTSGVTWTRNKTRGVNTVVARTPSGVTTATRDTPPAPPVRLTLDSTLVGLNQAAVNLPKMYLPDSDSEWTATGFRADISEHLFGVANLGWTLDYELLAWFALFAPVVIHGIPDEINLAGNAGIYAGQLDSAALTIANRRVLVDFALRRTLPRSLIGQANSADYNWLRTTFPTVTYKATAAVIDPDLTHYDLRLVRTP